MIQNQKLKFTLNPSVLSDWKDVDGEIIQRAVVGNRLSNIRGLRQVPNVVGSVELPFIYSNPSFTNIVCNTTTSGTTSLGTTSVSTCFVSVHEELCEQDLQGKTFSKFLNGKLSETLPFEEAIAAEFEDQISAFVEKQWFQGHPSVAVDGVLCNGLYYLLDSNSASTLNATYTALTASNAIGCIDYLLSLVPDAARTMPALNILLKPADWQALKIANRNADYFQQENQDSNPNEFKVPGYNNVYAQAYDGATSKIVISYGETLIQPYNLNSSIELYYDKSKRKYTKHADFRIGAGCHFFSHVVYAK